MCDSCLRLEIHGSAVRSSLILHGFHWNTRVKYGQGHGRMSTHPERWKLSSDEEKRGQAYVVSLSRGMKPWPFGRKKKKKNSIDRYTEDQGAGRDLPCKSGTKPALRSKFIHQVSFLVSFPPKRPPHFAPCSFEPLNPSSQGASPATGQARVPERALSHSGDGNSPILWFPCYVRGTTAYDCLFQARTLLT